ncbi:MAG: glucosamine-6-phosphate isomerase [Candidatus Neomarinimicrobiota bacterium]
MKSSMLSMVESKFIDLTLLNNQKVNIPYIAVDNFPDLGLLTSLRFLEWVSENPDGVVSLPTGKTPEYFIKWTHFILNNWNKPELENLRKENGLLIDKKPTLSQLRFVQIDEFYPLDSNQHNSFFYYVNKYYLKGFGLSLDKALLIDSNKIDLGNHSNWKTVFPEMKVDLTLRYRKSKTEQESIQQEAIYRIDQWCADYEEKIRNMGGIGFFLGGIGPDGHIAFNIRGSNHNSTTRLLETNFETQAAAATDLGGIEISRNRLVITIGLGTISYNPDAVAIILAAGEAKARIVKQSLEKKEDVKYPATVLTRLKNSRFYLTTGASKKLKDTYNKYWTSTDWNVKKEQRALLNLSKKENIFGKKLTVSDLKKDSICQNIPNLNDKTVPRIIKKIDEKVQRGTDTEKNQIYYHTGPHHDDIMLGMMPHIIHLIREPSNKHYFTNMTSGFTSVTNSFILKILIQTIGFIKKDKVQMIRYSDFFSQGYKKKWDKDVFHFLDSIANNNLIEQNRGLSHRTIRILVDIFKVKSKQGLLKIIDEIILELNDCYDGEKNSPKIQKFKGMIREYEEELVWANYGVRVRDIYHLRLGFYQGDVFTETPQVLRDVMPVLEQLREKKPTVISLALDPEGSGPDTHYKVLQTIANAVRLWRKETDLNHLRIWGYRNVWYRFDIAEADIIVPVTLNSMSILRSTFLNCYLSQKEASFPSHEFDGPFCDLSQKIWVEQHKELQLLLGRDYWYRNKNPHLRSVHGAVYLKEMNVSEFLLEARRLEESTEKSILLNFKSN